MPGGRPPKPFKKEYCQMLIEHMAQGLSFESFAADLKTCDDVLYRWVSQEQEFAEAKKEGHARCRQFYERMGLAGMAGKIPNFNVTAWIFNMKNRFRWRDKQDLEVTGQLDVKHQALTLDQIKEIFRNDPFIQLEKGKDYGAVRGIEGPRRASGDKPTHDGTRRDQPTTDNSSKARSGEGLSDRDVQDPFRKVAK